MPRSSDIEAERLLNFLETNQGAPSSRVIAHVYDHVSRSTAYRHLAEADRRGYIFRITGLKRDEQCRLHSCIDRPHFHIYTRQDRLPIEWTVPAE